jgi:Zn-dependent protease
MRRTMSNGSLRVLGFPVHLRPGFFLFMVLIMAIRPSEFGVWLAVSVAGFTLVHELGHAVVARRAGATAEISLDFLAGYASYEPSHPLSRSERAGIAFAGPAVHIALSTAILLMIGANPFELPSINDSPAHYAIFWAGPMIGVLNLLPILPLDGGNIVEAGLDRVLPGRAHRPMMYASLALTVAGVIWLALDERRQGFVVFGAFILIMQFQMLFSPGAEGATPAWERARDKLRNGDAEGARKLVVQAIHQPGPPMAPPSPSIDRRDLAHLVALLGPELPTGNANNEYVLANVLLTIGDYERAAFYAADMYHRHPIGVVAATVARAANAAGDPATAIAWLRTAVNSAGSPQSLAEVIDRAPELGSLRTHPDVIDLRRRIPSAPALPA